MESTEKPVATPISCEHTSGSVCAMGGWGQPNDQEAGLMIAEVRDGFPPIGLFCEGSALLVGFRRAPSSKARAERAGDNFSIQSVHEILCLLRARKNGAWLRPSSSALLVAPVVSGQAGHAP